jgi:hypothetical protein
MLPLFELKVTKLGCLTYTLLYHPAIHIKHEIPYLIKLHEGRSRGSWRQKGTDPSTPFPCLSPNRCKMLSLKALGLITIELFFSQTLECMW